MEAFTMDMQFEMSLITRKGYVITFQTRGLILSPYFLKPFLHVLFYLM
jgi:hypothetical protein